MRKLAPLLPALIAVLAMSVSESPAYASSLNSATLLRYPWIEGETRNRSQGQFGSTSHFTSNSLQWAVDWGLAGQSKLLFAPMAGTLCCQRAGVNNTTSAGFGTYIAIYNSTGNVTGILAHTARPPDAAECFPYGLETDTPVLQGQFIGVGDSTGTSTGDHIHFQLNSGYSVVGPLISVPFTMSDYEPAGANLISFPNVSATDGPSDNAGVGYVSQAPVAIDSVIASAYMAEGGASASWWNIGAPLRTPSGPCAPASTPFVHSCATTYGTMKIQNYVQIFTGVPSGIAYKNAGPARRVSGPIWALMSATFTRLGATNFLANLLGPPATTESSGFQYFDGGFVNRSATSPRQDVYLGGVWRATTYFYMDQAVAPPAIGICNSPDGNWSVGLGDVTQVSLHWNAIEGEPLYSPHVDINRDGRVGLGDVTQITLTWNKICVH